MATVPSALRVDTSEHQPVHLRIGRNGSYMRLSPSAHQLLEQVKQGTSFASIAQRISQQGPRQVLAAEVEAAYVGLQRRIDAIERKTTVPTGGFWLRCRLIPAAQVSRIAAHLTWAFHPAVAAFLLVAIILALALTAHLGLRASLHDFWPGYGLFLLSLLCHEFGHASACARYGAPPSDIGLIAYLIYPAFYCDVSGTWSLRRWQRVLVDLGGVYFQLLFGVLCALAYCFFPSAALHFCLALIVGSCLMSLNPILKFDGYWLVADALGVTNLGQQTSRIYRYALQRLLGRAAPPLPWTPAVAVLLAIYAVVSTGFWLLFMARLLPVLWDSACTYPTLVLQLVRHLRAQAGWPPWSLVSPLLGSGYMLLFVGFVLGRWTAAQLRRARLHAAPGEAA